MQKLPVYISKLTAEQLVASKLSKKSLATYKSIAKRTGDVEAMIKLATATVLLNRAVDKNE